MLLAVLLQENPERLYLCQSHVDEHLAYVAAQDGRTIAGGALRPQPEDAPQDALWLVHADMKEAAQALVEGEPVFKLGLRQSVDIFHWTKGSWLEPFDRCMRAIQGTEITA